MEEPDLVYFIDGEPSALQISKFIESQYRVLTYSHARTFLEDYQGQPGCVICNIRLSGISGLELQERLKQSKYFIPVIFMTAHNDATTAVQALKKGAFDFLLKPLDLNDLLDTVHQALERDRERQYWRSQKEAFKERLRNLTAREREVMQLMTQGKKTKEIARLLEVSPATIEVHRVKVRRKLLIKTLAELIHQLHFFNQYEPDQIYELLSCFSQ